jgi:FkbM family methyltransferase
MLKYITEIPANIKRVKIDIGLSYNAPHSQDWLENDSTNELFVFGFEPNPECVEIIKKGGIQKKEPSHGKCIEDRFLQNKFCLIPVALGNVTECTYMDFYQMTQDCGTSSLHKPCDESIGTVKSVTKVPVYSLKDFFDAFDWNTIPYIEYIKIDAQGSDLDILRSAGDYLKERVVYITAEPESKQYDDVSHNTLENMRAYLESQGFEYIKHPNTFDPTFLNSQYAYLKNDIYIRQYG